MILRRVGNKKKIAPLIIQHFPKHNLYIEPFFGAGGMFFSKPKSPYNIVNDLDSDVFNLYRVLTERCAELIEAMQFLPIHTDLFEHWKHHPETDPVRRAVRFIFISNFGYMGNHYSMRLNNKNVLQFIQEHINRTAELLHGVEFTNCDFRAMLNKISLNSYDISNAFIYADPPYVNTDDNYEHSFTEQDSLDLFDTLQASGLRFAISELAHPFILQQAHERGLNVIEIGSRQTLKNRETEILITSYTTHPTLFDEQAYSHAHPIKQQYEPKNIYLQGN